MYYTTEFPVKDGLAQNYFFIQMHFVRCTVVMAKLILMMLYCYDNMPLYPICQGSVRLQEMALNGTKTNPTVKGKSMVP